MELCFGHETIWQIQKLHHLRTGQQCVALMHLFANFLGSVQKWRNVLPKPIENVFFQPNYVSDIVVKMIKHSVLNGTGLNKRFLPKPMTTTG